MKLLNQIREYLIQITNIENDYGIDEVGEIEEFINKTKYYRSCNEDEIIQDFLGIFYINTAKSIKLLFFIRDKRDGLGERRVFKVIIKFLASEHPYIIEKIINYIYKYGRWDDYFALFDTKFEDKVISIFKEQIQIDLGSNNPSTLGKWLKSENASSKETIMLAKKTRILLGYSSKDYRKILTILRRRIRNNQIICKGINEVDKYKYSIRDTSTFLNFDNHANKIVNDILNSYYYKENTLVVNAIKEYDEDLNNTYISLLAFALLLFKKMNFNFFKNYYMSFKSNPKFNKILQEDYKNIYNTIKPNLSEAIISLDESLDLLLFTLIKKDIKRLESPKSILFIYNDNKDLDISNYSDIEEKWILSGYDMPKIKLWNLNSLKDEFEIYEDDKIVYIKGFEKDFWYYLLEGKEINKTKIYLNKFNKLEYNEINI